MRPSVSDSCTEGRHLTVSSIQRICDLMKRLLPQAQAETSSETLASPSEEIDSLIILDRSVDMVTPMLTQLTYEGLIDEFIGIEHC